MPSNLPDQEFIWDLPKASPEYKAVGFAFLGSIVAQRKHRIVECPETPYSHFAPAMRLNASKIQQVHIADINHTIQYRAHNGRQPSAHGHGDQHKQYHGAAR